MGVVEVIEYMLWWWVENVGFFLDCNGSVHNLLWSDCWMGWHLFVFVFFHMWIAWWVGCHNWLPSYLFSGFCRSMGIVCLLSNYFFKVLLFVSFVLAFQYLWFHWSQAPKLLGYWSLEACGVQRGLSSVLQAWSLYHQISSLRVCPHCWSFWLC